MYLIIFVVAAIILLLILALMIFLFAKRGESGANRLDGSSFLANLPKSNSSIGDNECVKQALEIFENEGINDFEYLKQDDTNDNE
jgi:hypothetical protein